tara:strand:- start:2349 stop:2660 length:312 start_codon:yes stop_codon:yes gene_type:complete
MRDPDRISKILKKLQIIWQAQPDLRLGQLLTNLSGRRVEFSRGGSGYDWQERYPDLYQIDDDEWMAKINNTLDELIGGRKAANGTIYYLDGGTMVTRENLYED